MSHSRHAAEITVRELTPIVGLTQSEVARYHALLGIRGRMRVAEAKYLYMLQDKHIDALVDRSQPVRGDV